jgi:hypothetical protein
MTFTQTLGWLLGLTKQANSLQQEEAVRRLMKYLTSKGIFRKDSLKQEKIYKDVESINIQMMSTEEAKNQAASSNMQLLIEQRWMKKLREKFRDEDGFVDSTMAHEMF